MMRVYVWLYMIAMILVLLGGVNWLSIGLEYPDLVKTVIPKPLVNSVYILVGLASIYLLFSRDTYLPFLGYSAVPSNVFQVSMPKDANIKVNVPVEYGASKVVYWATMSGDVVSTPEEGYRGTRNVGVAEITGDTVELNLMCPRKYKVWGKILPKHVHYRFIMDTGILSPVKTAKVECE